MRILVHAGAERTAAHQGPTSAVAAAPPATPRPCLAHALAFLPCPHPCLAHTLAFLPCPHPCLAHTLALPLPCPWPWPWPCPRPWPWPWPRRPHAADLDTRRGKLHARAHQGPEQSGPRRAHHPADSGQSGTASAGWWFTHPASPHRDPQHAAGRRQQRSADYAHRRGCPPRALGPWCATVRPPHPPEPRSAPGWRAVSRRLVVVSDSRRSWVAVVRPPHPPASRSTPGGRRRAARRQAGSGRRQTAGSERQAANGRQQTADGRQRTTADGRRQAADGRQRTAGSGRQAADGRQRTAGSERQAGDLGSPPPDGG